MKRLWMVSGGIESVPAIKTAKDMGLHVIVSDGNPCAPGFEFADEKFVIDTYDAQSTLKAVLQYQTNGVKINGVISVAADVPNTIAFVTDTLGLPGISIESAKLVSDKLLMKQKLQDNSIPIPWFKSVHSYEQFEELVKLKDFKLIVKPLDSRGARGVLVLGDDTDLKWAYEHSIKFSPTSRIMLEEFLTGPQFSTETLFVNGVGYTLGFADRNYEYLQRFSPYIIENGGEQPSCLNRIHVNETIKLAEKAAGVLGITHGIAKGDMVYTQSGPKVIEIAGRLSGGWFCTDQIPLATGFDLVRNSIKLSLGDELKNSELQTQFQKGVAIRYFFPKPGKVTTISNVEKFRSYPWVHKLMFFIKPGDIVQNVTDHTKRSGFVITSGRDRAEAVDRAKLVVDSIRIDTRQ